MSFRRLGLLLALPTMVGLSLAACGTEDDAASGPSGGNGQTAGSGGTDETGGTDTGGNGASGGTNPEGGMGGREEPGPGGAGGDSAGGAGGDSAGGAGGDSASGAGGEGGAPGPVACHNILQAFDTDPGGSMGKYLTPSTGPVQSSTVEWDSTQGVVAVGAGKLNATFGAFSEQAQLSIYFPAATHWPTCNTKMHAKVKLFSAVDLSHVNGVSLSINSGNATSGRYSSQFVSTATWMMDTWYELELPFATASYQNPANTLPDFNDVNSMGVMIHTKTAGTTPVLTTLYVDDVWVE